MPLSGNTYLKNLFSIDYINLFAHIFVLKGSGRLKVVPITQLPEPLATLRTGHVYAVFGHNRLWSNGLVRQMALSENNVICCAPELLNTGKSESLFEEHGSSLANETETNRYASILLELPENGYHYLTRVLKDVAYWGRDNSDCIVIYTSSEQWFSTSVIKQKQRLRQIKSWCEAIDVSVCLLFSDFDKVGAALQHLQCYQLEFSGLVTVDGDRDHGRWSVWHWFNPQNTLTHCNLKLFFVKTQQLEIAEFSDSEAITDKILDRDRVYCLHNVLFVDEAVPDNWQFIAEIDDLLAINPQIQAAFILLAYTHHSAVAQLSDTILKLRRRLGNQVKIIVRETGDRMRHADERILTHFGASLVIPQSLPLSRLLTVMDSVRDLRFSRHISENDVLDLNKVINNQWSGYLHHQEFLIATQQLYELSLQYSVQLAFIELDLNLNVNPQHIIEISRFKRSGDICTVNNGKIYVCLFGCREADAPRALRYILGMEVSSIAHIKVLEIDIGQFERLILISEHDNHQYNAPYAASKNFVINLKALQNNTDIDGDWRNTKVAKKAEWPASPEPLQRQEA